MSELENIENVEEVEVIPTDNTTEELQENVEQSTGEVSGEVSSEVIEDNSAEIEAEQERLRREHEEYLNSFPDTTVWYRDLLVKGDVKSLGTVVRDPRVAEQWGFLDNHYDESELTYIGTPECGIWYLKGYEKPEPTEEEKMLAYEKKIEADIDNYLQELVSSRGYDDVKSCVGYYNSTDETFQREAQAISKHRDQLYRKGYDLIAQCKKGEIDYKIIDLQYILNLIDPLDW